MGARDRRKLWKSRFAWTPQTRCPHPHSSDRKKRRKRLEDSFEEEENRNGRRLYTLISAVPGPSDGVHLTGRRALTPWAMAVATGNGRCPLRVLWANPVMGSWRAG